MKSIPILAIVALTVFPGTMALNASSLDTELGSILSHTTRLVLRTGGQCHRDRTREDVLEVVTNRSEIRSIVSQVHLVSPSPGEGRLILFECGDYTLDLYHQDELQTSITIVGLSYLRCPAINSGEDVRISGESSQHLVKRFRLLFDPEWEYDEATHQLVLRQARSS